MTIELKKQKYLQISRRLLACDESVKSVYRQFSFDLLKISFHPSGDDDSKTEKISLLVNSFVN